MIWELNELIYRLNKPIKNYFSQQVRFTKLQSHSVVLEKIFGLKVICYVFIRST